MQFIKYGVLGLALVLGGCFEVEDKSDKKVVAALEEQNRILREQAQASSAAAEKTSVSLVGIVKDLSTSATVTNATVTVKIGSTIAKVVDVTNGTFTLSDLPPDSDYELVVHSNNNQFIDRTFFGQTQTASAPGASFQDIGRLEVSPGIEKTFEVVDTLNGQPVSTFVFIASSNVGQGASAETFWHKAQYDTVLKKYKITVPELIDVQISASLDVNNDGLPDYDALNSSTHLSFPSSMLNTYNNFIVNKIVADASKNIEVRMSILDQFGVAVPDLQPTLADALNGVVSGIYDPTTKQYVFDVVITDELNVVIPAFSFLGQRYLSEIVSIDSVDENRYSIYGNNLGSYYQSFSENEEHILNIVARPYVSSSPMVSMLSANVIVSMANLEWNLYFSDAVTVPASSLELIKTDGLVVVPGNSSSSDLILSGTTQVQTEQSIDLDHELLLGNTLLKASPVAALSAGRYQFRLSSFASEESGVIQSTNYQSGPITVLSTALEFSINEIKLDNNNYFTQQSIIKAQNTAGISSGASSGYGSVTLYFPPSIASLKNLTLTKRSKTSNNVTSMTSDDNIDVVTNGNLNAYYTALVSTAQNENILYDGSYNLYRGTALTDGYWYVEGVSEYMMDSTDADVNSITFEYSYETSTGVVTTGVITLPVL